MTQDQIVILLILASTMALFIYGRWRHDVVALHLQDPRSGHYGHRIPGDVEAVDAARREIRDIYGVARCGDR